MTNHAIINQSGQTPLENEIMRCHGGADHCRLWNDGVSFEEGVEYLVHTIRDGMTIDFGILGMPPQPLWTDIILCLKHLAAIQSITG